MKQYEITEENDWEGETFGYIVMLTEKQAKQIEQRFEEINDGEEILSIEESNYDQKTVDLINKKSKNSYMNRLGFYTLNPTVDLTNFDYNDFPYKGNGLTKKGLG